MLFLAYFVCPFLPVNGWKVLVKIQIGKLKKKENNEREAL
jgi:hypothetical protein